MDDTMVGQVRRFNRIVTQRVGALHDHYLAMDRPLGEARLLWEIGIDGSDIRALRARLDLDSGYLSRLLRSLEADGLVTMRQRDGDKRVRSAHLTPGGEAERDLLDQRADALARSLLEPLTGARRERLISAMGEVERLLTAALVEFHVVDPGHRHANASLRAYFAELEERFDEGFDPSLSLAPDAGPFRSPQGTFVVVTLRADPIGCGGLRFTDDRSAELKRMWVAPTARGLGVGRRLLADLEARAAATGARSVRLETNRALTEAIAMYRSAGYREVPPFNDERYAHHWFEKKLDAPPG